VGLGTRAHVDPRGNPAVSPHRRCGARRFAASSS
jgi:hypothetical protein